MNPYLDSLSSEDREIAENAIRHVKEHKREIIEQFVGAAYPSTEVPISMFMAGSPGAGKTEISKELLKSIGAGVARLDPDEIRLLLPGYTGANSSIFQSAINHIMEKICDYVLDKSKSFILDGTLSSYEVAKKNILRSIKKGRRVIVVFVYQEPSLAWRFTKQREIKEGRNIPKEAFIKHFLGARQSVQMLKDEFGKSIEIWFIERNLDQDNRLNIHLNVDKIDAFVSKEYSEEELNVLIV